MVIPVVTVVDGDGDEPPSISFRSADQNTPCSTGVAGLYADSAIQRPQQPVVIAQMPVADGYGFGGYDLLKGRILQSILGQMGKIRRRGMMIFTVQTVGIFKVGLVQRKLLGLEVHQVDKLRHAVRAGQRQSYGCIVT